MTIKDRIAAYLQKHPEGVDDDMLARNLNLKHRQQANSCCRQLEEEGLVERRKVGGKIHNFWIGGEGRGVKEKLQLANKEFVIFVFLIALATASIAIILAVFKVWNFLLRVNPFILSAVVFIGLIYIGFQALKVDEDNIKDENLKYLERNTRRIFTIVMSIRDCSWYTLLVIVLSFFISVGLYYSMYYSPEAKKEVFGKLIDYNGNPIARKKIYFSYDYECSDAIVATTNPEEGQRGHFTFEDIVKTKNYIIYLKDDGTDCDQKFILYDREKDTGPGISFLNRENIHSIGFLGPGHFTPPPPPTPSLTPSLTPSPTPSPTSTNTPTPTQIPTDTPLPDIFDSFGEYQCVSENFWVARRGDYPAGTPVPDYEDDCIVFRDILDGSLYNWEASTGGLYLPTTNTIQFGRLDSKTGGCEIEEIQVVISEYIYSHLAVTPQEGNIVTEGWVGLVVPNPSISQDIGLWISSRNIGTETNTRAIYSRSDYGNMLQETSKTIVDNFPQSSEVILSIRFDGKNAILHVGNIPSDDISLDAVGYPSVFVIKYKAQYRAQLSFLIDEVRIKYRSNSDKCKHE